jgi:diacylglycerol kinase family enzyme
MIGRTMIRGRCKLIFNPAAGQGKAAGRLAEVEALLRARGIDYKLYLTKAVGHATELARDAARDGLLDLCMAESLSRGEMVGLMLMYTKGTQAAHPKVKTERSSRFEVLAPAGGLVVHADGETICTNGTSIVAECRGSKLRLLSADE